MHPSRAASQSIAVPSMWLVALALALVLGGCDAERPTEIVSIAIDGLACDGCPTSVAIDRAGGVRERVDPSGSVDAFVDRAYGDVIGAFPLDEFESARERVDADGPSTIVMLTVRFRDGSIRSAPVALGRTRSTRTGRLARWTEATAREVDAAVLGPRRRAIAEAISRHAIRSVTLEKLGCYGSCDRYTAIFSANDSATLRVRCTAAVRSARVTVAFERVLAFGYDLRWLRPVYPFETKDTEAARITIASDREIFRSFGPDRTTWDAPFVVVESHLDQLVRDLPWRPNVSLACR